MSKPFCFVASPFAGEGVTAEAIAADVARNIEFAESICRRVALETSLIPLAPHLVFPRFLRDRDLAERALGISYAKRIMPLCAIAIFGVPPWRAEMSSGMKFERGEATRMFLPWYTFHGDSRALAANRILAEFAVWYPRK